MTITYAERVIMAHALKVYAVEVTRGLGSIATVPEIRALHERMLFGDYGRCEHPGLFAPASPHHPRRERDAYQAWLDSTILCRQCGCDVPVREL